MSQSERERALRALVDKWRREQKVFEEVHARLLKEHGIESAMYVVANNLKICADQLAAALDTPQEPTPDDLWPKCQWCRFELEKFARTAGKCTHCGALQFERRDTLPAAPTPAITATTPAEWESFARDFESEGLGLMAAKLRRLAGLRRD